MKVSNDNKRVDPLFKIKQIFGSVEEFEKEVRKVGNKGESILTKITHDNLKIVPRFMDFQQNKANVDAGSSCTIVAMLKKSYEHHLSNQ